MLYKMRLHNLARRPTSCPLTEKCNYRAVESLYGAEYGLFDRNRIGYHQGIEYYDKLKLGNVGADWRAPRIRNIGAVHFEDL